MDVDSVSPTTALPAVSRDKTAPFLIRTFVKIGSFHRLSLFEDGTLPTTDEQQVFIWKDATLREVLTSLRNTAPHVPEYRHPLARFSFRTVYADSGNKGRFSQKDLGMVYSRDILGEPGSLNTVAPRLREDVDGDAREPTEREREERTLDELRFVPGDYLLIAVLLPKNVTLGNDLTIKGSAAAQNGPGWKAGGDGGWGGHVTTSTSGPPSGRGGGHWRGDSNGRGRGGAGRGVTSRGEDRDDRRIPPPRSPRGRGGGWGERGGRGGRRSPRSRSRSPSRRRGRYN